MLKALKYSFRHALPIMISFIPVGIVYGILMQASGYSWLWSGGCSLFVFAGSLQYLMIEFFTGSASYVTVAVMALLLNSRHIFYGLPFLEKWKDYGPLKWLLVFMMTDEAFSLHISSDPPEGVDRKLVSFLEPLFTLVAWIAITVIGGLVGSLITFDTSGMDFALTALFIVIVLEQLKSSKSAVPALVAAGSSVLCLLVIGPAYFILPSLLLTVTALMLLRPGLEAKYGD